MAPRLSDADHEMMKAMIQRGEPTKQIAQSIPCDPRTVRKAKARYRLFESTKAPPNRVGHHKKVTPYKRDALLDRLAGHPTTDRTQMVTFLRDAFEDDVSLSAISRLLKDDSKKLASISSDAIIRIWNAETGKCERELKGHSSWVMLVVYSHDSKKLVSISNDKTIRIWNAETGECEDVIPLDGYADTLSFTSNQRGIVTNRGVFAPSNGSQSHVGFAMPWQRLDAPTIACTGSTWITVAGKDLLWLPPECRDGKAAVSGSTFAIGCPSGRVVFLGISMADVEKWTGT